MEEVCEEGMLKKKRRRREENIKKEAAAANNEKKKKLLKESVRIRIKEKKEREGIRNGREKNIKKV
jgi:hypothetical protein